MTTPTTQAGYREWSLLNLAEQPGMQWSRHAWKPRMYGAVELMVVPGYPVTVESDGTIAFVVNEVGDVRMDYQQFGRLATLIDCIRKADVAFVDGPARY